MGPTDYCLAFVMARSSGIIKSLKKNKAKPKQGPLLGGAVALPTCELPTSLSLSDEHYQRQQDGKCEARKWERRYGSQIATES